MMQLQLFDYAQLDPETGRFVQARASEIKALMKRTVQDIVEIGLKLGEVKSRLGYGAYGDWLKVEFGWTDRTAQRFINVSEKFEHCDKLSDFGQSALYLLAAPSTPDEARQEAIERAEQGEHITHKAAKDIVENHKSNGQQETPEDDRPLFSPDPDLDAALDDQERAFTCLDCNEVFDHEVWHCPFCDHHWLPNRTECSNCYNDRPNGKQADEVWHIKKQAPDLFEQVKAGELAIPAAMKEFKKRKRKERIEQERAGLRLMESTEAWRVTDNQDITACEVLITDPPYNIINESWDSIEDFETFTRDWLSRWNDCGARFFVSFWSQEYLFDGKNWFDESLTNYEFQQLLIWHYPNNKSPQSRRKFKQTYEPIFFYRHKDCNEEVVIDSGDWGDEAKDFDCLVAAVPQTNYNEVDFKEHPAQKPLKVMQWLVLNLSKSGDLIIDPFCGSATTGIAAVKLGRKFHGIETNYLKLAKERMSQWSINDVGN